MHSITDLPCELVGEILSNLDRLRHLPTALLTCRHFYASFEEIHGVEASILRHQVTPGLLPIAVALLEASRLPRPLDASSVISLLDEPYSQPARLAARVPTLPATLVREMGRIHDIIHTFATDFASSAWDRISPGTNGTTIVLSPSEYFRFCHAFYRIELIFRIFRGCAPPRETYPWLFSKHAPWENEQLACAFERLETKFAEASFDVLAHDIDFGELSINYLDFSSNHNISRQRWLSQGIEFIYKLTISEYDAKLAMLEDTYVSREYPDGFPLSTLMSWHSARMPAVSGTQFVLEFSEEEPYSSASHRSDRLDGNSDRGPYEAWCSVAQTYPWPDGSVMDHKSFWLRERAYVLWDGERMQKQAGGFGEDPKYETSFGYTKQDYKDMYDSFEERSRIWLRGAAGYWSKSDTSRIVWGQSMIKEDCPLWQSEPLYYQQHLAEKAGHSQGTDLESKAEQ